MYFGDIHGQSNRSIGFGTEREYFSWARDGELLDFVAPANHYGGRENVTNDLWQGTLDLCDEFNTQGRFATLLSYEWGGRSAHRNVYYRDIPGELFHAHHPDIGSDITRLWGALEHQELDVITIPHHVKFLGRIDWNEFNAEYQRLVEVCSCWGNSEEYGPHSVQHGLAMGTTELERVEIIRNNEIWQTVDVKGKEKVRFEFEDIDKFSRIALQPKVDCPGDFIFYYLRVQQKNRHRAMSSPIWVTGK